MASIWFSHTGALSVWSNMEPGRKHMCAWEEKKKKHRLQPVSTHINKQGNKNIAVWE